MFKQFTKGCKLFRNILVGQRLTHGFKVGDEEIGTLNIFILLPFPKVSELQKAFTKT